MVLRDYRTASHLSTTHSYQALNKLTSTTTASYDNNGNLLTKTDSQGTSTFTWNQENQLTQVSLPGGLSVNYQYDGLGRRIQRTTSAGVDERYVYDGQDVLLDLNADGSVAQRTLATWASITSCGKPAAHGCLLLPGDCFRMTRLDEKNMLRQLQVNAYPPG